MKTKVLITEEEIVSKVKELGGKISEYYKDKNLLVVSLLRGAFMFTSDLVKNIEGKMEIEFISASSYGDAEETSGRLDIQKGIDRDISMYDVLIVDDIVDSGISMTEIVKYIRGKKPRSIKVCTLLDKKSKRKVACEADYVGYEIEDHFVVGYGLDYKGQYRNKPYVFVVIEE